MNHAAKNERRKELADIAVNKLYAKNEIFPANNRLRSDPSPTTMKYPFRATPRAGFLHTAITHA
jgi:hypothetical protein